MNKLSIFLLIISFMSCSGSGTKKQTESASATGEVVFLNKTDFITKVYDYEKTPEGWNYEGEKPCIIDFYADWCGPCKRIAPVLKELAVTYKDSIIIYKINIDEEEELAAVFGIQSIPSLLFVPATGQPKMSVGAISREELVSQIDNFLLNNDRKNDFH